MKFRNIIKKRCTVKDRRGNENGQEEEHILNRLYSLYYVGIACREEIKEEGKGR